MSVPFVPSQTLHLCGESGLVTAGDSLQYYPGAALVGGQINDVTPHPVPQLGEVDFINSAIGGSTCQQKPGTYATYDAPLYRSIRTRNIASLGCGNNDYIAGRTPAQVYADMLSWNALAQATGYQTILFTVQSSFSIDPNNHTWRPDINALITAGAVANGYTVVDWGANADIGCDNCYLNGTYYTDGTHFTTAGNAIAMGLLKTALQGLGFK